MKLVKFSLGCLCIVGVVSQCCAAIALSVDEIVAKANHAALYQGEDCKGTISLLITDKQGRERTREINILRKDVGKTDGDQKYFTYFFEPSDVRKMVFMVHKHAAPQKDDDRWLYMPGLDLVKRIAASDKRISFVGSDFLYEDISGRSLHEDVHELMNETEAYYVIKNMPKDPGSVEFAYYRAFIDKQTFIPMKIEYYKVPDRLYREIEVVNVGNVFAYENGVAVVYPTVTKSIARDTESGSRTEMVFSNVTYNAGLKDSLFSERYLRRPPKEVMR